jgi:hypothetical protein
LALGRPLSVTRFVSLRPVVASTPSRPVFWHWGGGEVSTYITLTALTALTAEGAHTVHANPDPPSPVADDVAKFGCKVVAEYAVLGGTTSSRSSTRRVTRRWLISASITVHVEPPGSRRCRRSRCMRRRRS